MKAGSLLDLLPLFQDGSSALIPRNLTILRTKLPTLKNG
jgi:hypothetical protein